MKLSENFIVHNFAGGVAAMPTSKAAFSGVVQGNATLAALLELLRTETTEEQLVAGLKERFDGPEETIRKDVARALAELRKIGAIDE